MRLHQEPALNAALLRLSAATLARLAVRSGRDADEARLTLALERAASLREAYEAACTPRAVQVPIAEQPEPPSIVPEPPSMVPAPDPQPMVAQPEPVPSPPPPELPERHFLDGPSLIGLPQEPENVTQSAKRPGKWRGLLGRR